MARIISERSTGPDDPIYSEPLRSYSPHLSRTQLRDRNGRARLCHEEWINMVFGSHPPIFSALGWAGGRH